MGVVVVVVVVFWLVVGFLNFGRVSWRRVSLDLINASRTVVILVPTLWRALEMLSRELWRRRKKANLGVQLQTPVLFPKRRRRPQTSPDDDDEALKVSQEPAL